MTEFPDHGWNWLQFQGSRDGLALNRRDLPWMDAVLLLVPGRTAVVQAGGNLGLFPKRLAQAFQTVYTFEPASDLFAMLMHNAPEANIVKFQAALGYERGLVGLSRERRDGKRLPDGRRKPTHEGITHVCGSGVVPTLRIDDLALPVCDLIYLDVEGSELAAVQGASETLARARPVLVVEMNQNAGYVGLTHENIRAVIQACGYRLADRVLSDEIFLPVELAA